MASQPAVDDEVLTRYLLGSLPEDESERLDELSVADDEVASRLQAVENDLVDRYVRGEMSGETLARFESTYLASPGRRQKIEFATALASVERLGRKSSATSWWALAAAAAVAIVVIAVLAVIPQRQPQMTKPDIVARVAQPNRVPSPRVRGEGARSADEGPRSQAVPLSVTATFLLPPPARGAGSIETLRIPDAAQRVIVRLQLESDDFPEYQAALRDLVANEIVWRSNPVTSAPEGTARSVAIEIPRDRLHQQNYGLELSGLPRGGPAEIIGTYAFHVLAK